MADRTQNQQQHPIQRPGQFQGRGAYGQPGGFGGYGMGRSMSPAQRQVALNRGQIPVRNPSSTDWGTEPYYGGYGYDFRGEGFGGMAQGYPNPGFGSSGQRGGMTSQGPHAGKGPKRSDSRIQDEVSQRLTQHGQLDASNIDVKVNDSIVTLSGSVASRQAKRTAEDVADAIPGVRDVLNQLTIQQGQRQPQTVH
ncbi:MAG TPA: BON domain-containing protein [Thermomicrobiaceae bacterium]|nr:BON domain-containing protein [Thermomicrobiaceae bacterium]